MNAIHPIAQTADTVTLRRADFEAILDALEDAEDIATLAEVEERERILGKEAVRANYLPVELVERLLEGEHPVQIWREHRGLSQHDLAEKAGLGRSYLNEIEGRKKPGSVAAYRKLANALGTAIDDLLPAGQENERR